jgi:DNA-binding transcriptional LysR family regulator
MMNLRAVETFLWVARLGSLRAAAQRLNISQSTASARIAGLEKELGVNLLTQSGRNIELTAAAGGMIVEAERLMAQAEQLRMKAGSPTAYSGTVRVGVVEVIAVSWLPALVQAVARGYSAVTLELTVAPTAELLGNLRRGHLDLALLPGPLPEGGLRQETLGSVQWAWAIPPDFVSSTGRLITPAVLDGIPLITLGRDSLVQGAIQRWYAEGRARPGWTTTCSSLHVAATLAMSGVGVTLLPTFMFPLKGAAVMDECASSPVFPPFDYWAASVARRDNELTRLLARLASQATTFR